MRKNAAEEQGADGQSGRPMTKYELYLAKQAGAGGNKSFNGSMPAQNLQ